MKNLILIRHGESIWNLENRFTGWFDVELTPKGKEEAETAGKLIKNLNIEINKYFTSYQKRAVETLSLAIKKLEGEIYQIEANIRIYLDSPTQTVADHIDYTGTVEKELAKLSSAKEKLEAIKSF